MLGALHAVFGSVLLARPLHERVREAVRSGALAAAPVEILADRALAAGVIGPEEPGDP